MDVSPPSHGTKPLPDSFSRVQGLNQQLRLNLQQASIATPTPVQRHCIPLLSAGHDAMVCAQTGLANAVHNNVAMLCITIPAGPSSTVATASSWHADDDSQGNFPRTRAIMQAQGRR